MITTFLVSNFVFALDSSKIAVFYPESKEPYRSIYQEIVSGSLKANSESDKQYSIEKFTLNNDFDAEKITKELIDKGINRVIVLGRLGYKLAKNCRSISMLFQERYRLHQVVFLGSV